MKGVWVLRRSSGLKAAAITAVTTLAVVGIPLAVMAAVGGGSASPVVDNEPASVEQTKVSPAGDEGVPVDAASAAPEEAIFRGQIVAKDLPSGFYLAEERGLAFDGELESARSVYVRGSDPDDEDWAIIRVRWLPGLSLDVDSWVAERGNAEPTTVLGIAAVAEIADPSSPDDGVKVLRFATRGGVVLLTANGPVTIGDLKVVAEGLEFEGAR